MSEGARALAFFDSARQRYGTARGGATLLFEGHTPTVIEGGPAIEQAGEGKFRASLPDRLDLELEQICDPVELGGVTARACTVRGDVEGTDVDCLGTLSETHTPPSWEELDALRSVSVLLDEEHAALALARRPRGVHGHGEELVVAWILEDGELLRVEDARISTVYDGDGRQRSAGLELWLPGEDFPRRGSGTVVAGSSLELEGLTVHAAIFGWRFEGRDGMGAYELMVREATPAAA